MTGLSDLTPVAPSSGGGGTGTVGPEGPAGVGVPVGGATNEVLAKASAADYDTTWMTPATGGGAPAAHASTHIDGGSDPILGPIKLVSGATTDRPVQIQAAAGQTANLIETFNPSLQRRVGIGPSGTMQVYDGPGTSVLAQMSNLSNGFVAANGYLSAGTSAAVTGAVRMNKTGTIAWRNQANTADVVGLSIDGSNALAVGAPLNLGGFVAGNGATPVAATDLATKGYVDGLAPAGGGIDPTLFDANSILKADVDNTPVALTVAPSTFVGRDAAGSIAALTATQAKAILGVTSADVSDFNTAVRLNRLDQMASPTATVNMGSQVITALAAPTNPTDAVNKAYADSVASGLDFKASVRAATVGNIDMTSTVSYIDDVRLFAGSRVLVKDQTNAAENGIYIWDFGPMTRASDANQDAEVTPGLFVFVEEGTVNGDKAFVLTTDASPLTGGPIVVGTTPLTFTLFSGGGTSVVGTTDRITVTGTQIDVAATYVGQTSITTLGAVTTGTWTGTPVAVANGGTGATTAAGARTNLGISASGTKFTAQIGNASLTSFTVTHNLNTKDVLVDVYDTASGATVYADVVRTTVNAITISGFHTVPTTNQYSVVVFG
jgi:hypothetical protein